MKMDLMMLAPCGIYCGTCDIHVAGRDKDVKTQARIANWLAEHHNADCRPDQIRCGGCWGALADHWSADCKILKCAKERKLKLCSSSARAVASSSRARRYIRSTTAATTNPQRRRSSGFGKWVWRSGWWRWSPIAANISQLHDHGDEMC